ncbi:hypothetical protein PV341_16275 [Streptomyces sp. PA03-1a]|nr:hypothetical protein [Streptomyces sp. PA03-1a]MDX2813323.1 hypothetical protein [Streptomyces sp. PA03-5A]
MTLFGLGSCLGRAVSGQLTNRAGQRTALVLQLSRKKPPGQVGHHYWNSRLDVLYFPT